MLFMNRTSKGFLPKCLGTSVKIPKTGNLCENRGFYHRTHFGTIARRPAHAPPLVPEFTSASSRTGGSSPAGGNPHRVCGGFCEKFRNLPNPHTTTIMT